ncbi:MAG: YhfC family glutamic-type intramembrane protease, partial [Clostridia bacterium]|nr:YhfC family glutamic-type intramembrane protease [Clostridia bacterium]
MVSNQTIVFSIITLFLSLVLPIILAVWFCRKHKVSAVTVFLGALTFFVFQLVLRTPLMQALAPVYPGEEPINGGWKLVMYGLYLAVTAALFEEGGRAIVYKLFLKKKGDWNNAVAFGIGHGGFEAISIVGITYINNLLLIIMINMGLLNTSDGSNELMAQAVQALTDTQPILFLLAGIERVFAMILHIGFSTLVVYGLVSKRYIYVFYAFLAHFLLNFPLIFTQSITGGTYIAIAYIAVMAFLSFYWVIRV